MGSPTFFSHVKNILIVIFLILNDLPTKKNFVPQHAYFNNATPNKSFFLYFHTNPLHVETILYGEKTQLKKRGKK